LYGTARGSVPVAELQRSRANAIVRNSELYGVSDRLDSLAEGELPDCRNDLVKAQGFPALNKADATAATCIFTVTVCSSLKLIVVISFENCRMKVTRSGLT